MCLRFCSTWNRLFILGSICQHYKSMVPFVKVFFAKSKNNFTFGTKINKMGLEKIGGVL